MFVPKSLLKRLMILDSGLSDATELLHPADLLGKALRLLIAKLSYIQQLPLDAR